MKHWLLVLLIAASPLAARNKKANGPPQPVATIAGTVFHSPGFALAGAEVTVTPAKPEADGTKIAKQRTITNRRGEWAVRVPAVPMDYRLDVNISGFESQTKTVTIEGEQRKEINFLLESKSRK